jgi:hypothetical protein
MPGAEGAHVQFSILNFQFAAARYRPMYCSSDDRNVFTSIGLEM